MFHKSGKHEENKEAKHDLSFVDEIICHQIDSETSYNELISFFCIQKYPNFDNITNRNISTHIRFRSIHELRRRLVEDTQQISQLNFFPQKLVCELISPNYHWHCLAAYHEFWNSTLLWLFNTALETDCRKHYKQWFSQTIDQLFLESGSKFCLSFFEENSNENKFCLIHCRCNTVQCLLTVLQQHEKLAEIKSFSSNCEQLLQNYIFILKENSHTKSFRCFAFKVIEFFNEIAKKKISLSDTFLDNIFCNDLHDSNHEDINFFSVLQRYFEEPRCFGGRRPTVKRESNSIEEQVDCQLIRVYLILILRLFINRKNKLDSLNQFWKQVEQINKSIPARTFVEQQIGESSEINILYRWLIDLFMSDDGELFEMLHLYLNLVNQTALGDTKNSDPTTIPSIHHLFYIFLVAIRQDASTLLEMLTTDGATADALLRFLLTFLKLSFHDFAILNVAEYAIIREIFTNLRSKIERLNQKGLFPYNPRALLRLLENF